MIVQWNGEATEMIPAALVWFLAWAVTAFAGFLAHREARTWKRVAESREIDAKAWRRTAEGWERIANERRRS